MDIFKGETAVGYTAWDINSKWVDSKSRHKDGIMIKRSARRKAKQDLNQLTKELLENNQKLLDRIYC